MQRVYSGDLSRAWNCMTRADGGKLRSPMSATIVVHVGGSWQRNASELFWSGACAVALARALRRSGRACQVIGMFYARLACENGRGVCAEMLLQPMGRATDLETLAGVLCFAGWFRYYGFGMIASVPDPIVPTFGRIEDYIPHCVRTSGAVIRIAGVYDHSSAVELCSRETSRWR